MAVDDSVRRFLVSRITPADLMDGTVVDGVEIDPVANVMHILSQAYAPLDIEI